MIKELQDVSEKYKNKPSRDRSTNKVNVWFRSHFTVHKALTSYAALCPDPCFQNGVCKIQQGQWRTLTNAETEACEPLLKGNVGSIDSEIDQDTTPASPDLDMRLKRICEKTPNHLDSPYIDCNFIFGSAAQVEQMWSQAKYILSQQRSRMTPLLFETILYLKINDRFWDMNTVKEAINMAAAEDASERLRKREQEELEQEELRGDVNDVSDDWYQ